jgi:hypothetical protein
MHVGLNEQLELSFESFSLKHPMDQLSIFIQKTSRNFYY